MIKKESRSRIRQKKHLRIRNRFSGTAERPRLAVFRSNKHIYAQVIDDEAGTTLAAASTVEKDINGQLKFTDNKEAAESVGKAIAERAKVKGIEEVVFDRGGFLDHGKIQVLADAARDAGLKF